MTLPPLPEKLSLLTGADFWQTRDLPAHGIPPLVLSDGPHGLRKAADGASVGLTDALPATCFPTAAGLAASWDPALLEQVGRAIGEEARTQGVHVVLGPGLNLKRHPLGGRNFEYFSEDPLLSGRLAAAMVRGIQSVGVGACLKHFVANNHEDHRLVVDVRVDDRSLRELYLRGFEIAVREGAPWAVMSSYNRLNGAYTGESPGLIAGILRGEWGFDGLVVSDWGAVDDRVAGVTAGLDLEMPGSAGRQEPLLLAALKEGTLDEGAVDACVRRLLQLQGRVAQEPSPEADLEAHHALARHAAARSCVLLRNEGDLLPLERPKSVAVVGALAREMRFQGAGSSGVRPTRLVTGWQGLHDKLGSTVLHYAPGYTLEGDGYDGALEAEALRLAKQAEVAVVFAGLPPAFESEGYDRAHMGLPAGQDRLITALAAVCERVVVVLCNGAPVQMPWLEQVGAVLEGWLGGQAAGAGIADILTGAVCPSGKLAESFALRVEDHASHRGFPGDGQQVIYGEGLYVGYRCLDSLGLDVLFPFGHGLSYTRFAYRDLRCDQEGQSVRLRFTIENAGVRAGAEVVQVYVHDVEHTVYRPVQELRAFQRVELKPGEQRRVEVLLDPAAWSHWDNVGGRWAVEAGAFEIRVGASSRDIRLRDTVRIPSSDGPFRARAPACYHRPEAPFAPSREEIEALLGRRLPAPRPLRPFHRNSTVDQIRATWTGRLLHPVALRQTIRVLRVADQPHLRLMAERALLQMPMRALVTQAHILSWRQLEALLAWLNGHWLEALRCLAGRGRGREQAPGRA